MVSAPARRIAVFYAAERGIAQRRASALMEVARASLRYVPVLPQKNAPIAHAMRRLSGQYPRYGSRRIRVFLKREGIHVSKEKCSRLWAEQGLQVPKKRPRRRIATSRPRPLAPAAANSVWSYDFVFDVCANGPEFVSVALLKWVTEQGMECALIDPGKPWRNGTTESFNGKSRDECLAMEWFRNRLEAKIVIEDWRQHYNQVRPHSSLNYQTPEAFSMKAATLSTGAIPS